VIEEAKRVLQSYVYGFRRYSSQWLTTSVYMYEFALFSVPFQLIQLLVSLFSYHYYSVYVGGSAGTGFISYILIGLILSGVLNAALSSPRRAIREIIAGTYGFRFSMLSMYDYLRLAKIPKGVIIVANEVRSVSYQLIFALAYFVLGVLMGIFKTGFGVISLFNSLVLVLWLILSYVAIISIGFLAASYEVVIIKKYRFMAPENPVTWIVNVLSNLISGVYFPVSLLPPEIRALSFVIPQTHAIMGAREILVGDFRNIQVRSMVHGFYVLVLFPLSLLALRKAFKKIDELR